MNPVIRPLRLEDITDLVSMENAIFSVPWSEKAFADLLARPWCLYLVAEMDGKIAGCAGLVMLGDEGDVDKVMVAEPFRRRGIARALMRKLLAMGEARGISAFTLEVRAGNLPAITLYTGLGFVAEGIRPGFYEKPKEDAVIMWRRYPADSGNIIK